MKIKITESELKNLIKKVVKELKEETMANFYSKHNIDPEEMTYLGKGDFGEAYSIGNGMVLKITSSKSEFNLAKELQTNPREALVRIYDTEIVDNNMMIIEEELEEDSNVEDLFYQLLSILDEQGLPIQYMGNLDIDELNEQPDEEMIRFMDQIDDINRAYRSLGIEASDIRPENLGYDKNRILKAFDIDDKNK